MPGMDGYGLLARLRADELTTGRMLPIIALTAQASADEEARALAAGFCAYVRKPYRFEELIDAVATAALRPRTTPTTARS
jgi:CheY-like chemotaxis protein